MTPRKAEGRRILVTGAAGFVGGYAIAALREAYPSAEIIPAGLGGGPESLAFDISDANAARDAIKAAKPTDILHLAAISDPSVAGASPRAAWDINFTGVMNITEAALARDPSTRIVFAGSSECYGASFRTASGPIKESAALEPLNVYGATKAAADIYLGQLASAGASIVRFRPFNHTGPGQAPSFVAPAFATQIAAIEAGAQTPSIKVGHLDVDRDILDVRDVVRAYAMAFDCVVDSVRPAVMNLSTGAPVKIRRMLEILLGLSDRKITIEPDPARIRSNEIQSIAGDSARAAAILGWKPQIALEQTLKDLLDDCRQRVRRS